MSSTLHEARPRTFSWGRLRGNYVVIRSALRPACRAELQHRFVDQRRTSGEEGFIVKGNHFIVGYEVSCETRSNLSVTKIGRAGPSTICVI
jgi:hypothetical protein